ncbi:archaeal ATPase family protein [Candidatus Magnetomorum sp. HK-1]|nr:archaeal ATPase family protein [Candidatus Magnetomorum sp. HK-1]
MKFYNRNNEIKQLKDITAQTNTYGRMTVITGRRRVGKTILALKVAKNYKYIYLFISKKSEFLICTEFVEIIKAHFNYPIIGQIRQFRDIFKLLLEFAIKEQFVLIIDEFQEFYNINPSIYSEIQNLWDQYKQNVHMHVIFIGSVYSLMIKIFENNKEPLFGRADKTIYLKPFKAKTIKEILEDSDHYTVENLFHNYLITGGIPRYLELLQNNHIYSITQIIEFIIEKDSPFINEGKNLLIEEFGKEYGSYFSIIELLSMGKNSRSEIESILEINIGGYLDRLENQYHIISKKRPFNAKKTGRIQRYVIRDNFINFWFRFIYKYSSAIETENFSYVKQIIYRDLSTYGGQFLENLFHELIAETKQYNIIGNYWEKGNQNEIDLVAINELEKKLVFYEVKTNIKNFRIKKLMEKSKKIVQKYSNYSIDYKGLSLENINDYL